MKIDPAYVDSLFANISPQSTREDTIVFLNIIAFMNPVEVLELGTGLGDWLVASNNVLTSNAQFTGYDNFDCAILPGWPKNKYELEQMILAKNSFTNKPINFSVHDADVRTTDFSNVKFDMVRLDCLDREEDVNSVLDKILPHTTDNCLFFTDDITMNLCPGRLTAFLKKLEKNEFKIVWTGHKEMCWCKSSFNTDLLSELSSHLLTTSNYDRIISEMTTQELYGTCHTFYRTRN